MQFEIVKSMIWCVAPKETAGFGFDSVSGDSRSPAPPARTKTGVLLGRSAMATLLVRWGKLSNFFTNK